jgi:hypothetical protein
MHTFKIVISFLFVALKVHAFLHQDRALYPPTKSQSTFDSEWVNPVPAGAMHFRSLGTVVGTVHHAHLVMDFNITDLHLNITKLCEMTQAAWEVNPYPWENPNHSDVPTKTKQPLNLEKHRYQFSRNIAEVNKDLKSQCQTLLEDFEVLRQIWLPSVKKARNKRQIGLLVAFGIGLVVSYLYSHSSLLSINAGLTDNHEAHTVQLLQDHETRLEMNNRSIEILARTAKTTKMNVFELTKEMDYVENVLMLQTAYMAAESQVKRIIHGLYQLAHYRLSPLLVKPATLHVYLEKLRTAVSEKGLTLGIDHVEEVFHQSASHIVFENGTIRIFVHIPAYNPDSLLSLYQYEELPIPIARNMSVLPILDDHTILAINSREDKFMTLSDKDLHDCEKRLQLLYCPKSNYYDRRTSTSCLFSLYKNQIDNIKDNCEFTPVIKDDKLIQLSPQQYVLFQPKPQILQKSCIFDSPRDKHSFAQLTSGLVRVTVEPGCTAKTPSFLFEGSFTFFGDVIKIDTNFISDLSFVTDADYDALEAYFQETYNDIPMNLINSKKGLSVKDITVWYKTHQRFNSIKVGLMAIITFVILILLVLLGLKILNCYKRAKGTRLIDTSRQEIIELRQNQLQINKQQHELEQELLHPGQPGSSVTTAASGDTTTTNVG